MQELIIGGIYLDPDDNYLIVLNKAKQHYEFICLPKVLFSQKRLINETEANAIDNLMNIDKMVGKKILFTIEDSSDNLQHLFNNGYCGKVKKEFLNEIIKLTYDKYFIDFDSYYWK